jgi:pilus assembly protein CpaF
MLNRRLNEQAAKDQAQRRPTADPFAPQEEAAAPPSAPPSRPAAAPPSAAPSRPAAAPPSLAVSADQKPRLSGKLTQLRKLLRPKLLKAPDEADNWKRGEADKEQILTERMTQFVQKWAQERPELRLNQNEFAQLRESLLDDLLGFGAIQPLVDDTSVKEIMVNGPEHIWAEKKGLYETEFAYDDEEHLLFTAQRIVRRMGRRIDRANPMTDARLPDGSRVHIVTNPSSLNGTTITIRKFPAKPLTVDDLINYGSLTRETAQFLEACVKSRLNIVVSGGTGSGKTTLLNVLSAYIPEDERIVTVEDAAELQLKQPHVVRLETAPPMPDGDGKQGTLTIRDLVRGSLRMRPDRIVIGECRAGEALDMLQAMNTGHDGSLTTVHANNPRDTITRLETLVMMSGMDLPLGVVRRQIVSAVDMIVQIARLKDHSRKIIQITEIQGMEGEQVTLQDIFIYRAPGSNAMTPMSVGGGTLESTGFRPGFIDRLEENGFRLSGKVFGAGQNRFVKNT